MGFKGPEVQILSPRPKFRRKYRELAATLTPFFLGKMKKVTKYVPI